MASRYSKVQSSIWASKKLRAAKELSRYVYMYLLTSPHNNSAGFYHLPIGYATQDLLCSPQKFRNAISDLINVGLIEYADEVVLVKQFLRFNPFMNPNHAKSAAKEVCGLVDNPLFGLWIEEVKRFCGEYLTVIDTILKQYRDSIETVSKRYLHKDKAKAKATETETETNNNTNRSVPNGTTAAEETEADETADKKPAPKDEYQSLFEHYLSLGLIKHKTLTKEMKNAIDTARRRCGYSWDELKTLAERHAYVVELTKAEGQYAVEKRGITEFFGQKVKDGTALICSEYADDGAKWLRYKDGLPKRCADEHKSQYKDLREGYW